MPFKPFAALSFLAFACVLVTGCAAPTTVPHSVLPRTAGNDAASQLDYWHEVATKPLISNDEALHGVLLYLDDKDDATTYEQRVATLKSRGYLHKSFNAPAGAALERATLAVPLAKSLNLTGGLTMHLFGLAPRYCMRELEYRGVYPTSSGNQIFTGSEFVGVIGKVVDLRFGDPTNLPAAVVLNQTPEPEDAVAEEKKCDDVVAPILAMMAAPELSELSLRPTTGATTQSGPFKVVITAVEGLASVRADENSPWQVAKKGMEFGESAEFRTGPRGTIQFVIPPDQTVSVDRLTTLKVMQVSQKGGKVTTDLGIKYGRTRYDLEGGGLEHQSTLRSPNATLAVRGTKVSLFDQPPFQVQAVSLTGRAEFQAARRRALAFGNKGQGKTVVNAESQTAGSVYFAQSVVDPTLPGARTSSEQALLATVISRGAFTSIDNDSGIKIVRGGVPPTDAQLVPALPGQLNFVLRWSSNVNLNLGVSTPGTTSNPGGEFVYPARGLNIAPSGGKTAFDHQGGANGGIEVVYFDKYPDGIFSLAGQSLTPNTTVTATLQAYLNGKPIDLFDGQSVTQTVTQTVSANQPALALVAVNTPLPFATPQSVKKSKTSAAKPVVVKAPMPPMGPSAVFVPPAKAR